MTKAVQSSTRDVDRHDEGVIIVQSAIAPIEAAAPIAAPDFDEPAKGAPRKSSKPSEPGIKTKKDLDARKTEAKPEPEPKSKSRAKSAVDDDPRLF